ncbi:MAG: sensor histidine kinase, partial [Planctomycetaceae bacterium]
LESLAEFAAGAGHEINNPLATIIGRTEQLLRDETDPERRRALTTIGGQALRVRDMIGDLMLFARPPAPIPESVNLGDAVETVVAELRGRIDDANARLEIAGDRSATLFADPGQLRIVIGEILRNSLHALPEEMGEITIGLGLSTDDGATSGLTIADNGCGLTEADRRHLFDPFYSGRQAGRGLGFGLCKCWRIVSNHGGLIEVESGKGRTTFRVCWPAC